MLSFRFPAKRSIQILSVLPLFTLTGCDGYEMQPYHGVPYCCDRTAGSGVEYVLAKMAPQKGPVLETVPTVETPAPPVVETQPEPELAPAPEIHDAAPMFDKMQKK